MVSFGVAFGGNHQYGKSVHGATCRQLRATGTCGTDAMLGRAMTVRRSAVSRVAFIVVMMLGGTAMAGCEAIPAQLRGGEPLVMEVANDGPRPVSLAVGSPGDRGVIRGAAEPAILGPGQTATVRFLVPPGDQWAIFVDDNELMGTLDVGPRRGVIPMGIEIAADGSVSWWCRADCP